MTTDGRFDYRHLLNRPRPDDEEGLGEALPPGGQGRATFVHQAFMDFLSRAQGMDHSSSGRFRLHLSAFLFGCYLLVIAISIAGLAFGKAAAMGEVVTRWQGG